MRVRLEARRGRSNGSAGGWRAWAAVGAAGGWVSGVSHERLVSLRRRLGRMGWGDAEAALARPLLPGQHAPRGVAGVRATEGPRRLTVVSFRCA
jgi:hypothetical protein